MIVLRKESKRFSEDEVTSWGEYLKGLEESAKKELNNCKVEFHIHLKDKSFEMDTGKATLTAKLLPRGVVFASPGYQAFSLVMNPSDKVTSMSDHNFGFKVEKNSYIAYVFIKSFG